jgi:hypothetical protein
MPRLLLLKATLIFHFCPLAPTTPSLRASTWSLPFGFHMFGTTFSGTRKRRLDVFTIPLPDIVNGRISRRIGRFDRRINYCS